MGCCIALAFLISLARRGWYAIAPGGPPAREFFAPPAQRSVDGSAPRPRALEPDVRRRVRPAAVLGAVLSVGGMGWLIVSLVGMHTASSHTGCDCCCTGAHTTVLTHLLAHGPGLLVIALGAVLLLKFRTSAAVRA